MSRNHQQQNDSLAILIRLLIYYYCAFVLSNQHDTIMRSTEAFPVHGRRADHWCTTRATNTRGTISNSSSRHCAAVAIADDLDGGDGGGCGGGGRNDKNHNRSHPMTSKTNDECFRFDYTGMDRRSILWKNQHHSSNNRPVPLQSELALLKSGVLVKRGEFHSLQGRRLQELEAACKRVGMTVHQGLIVRKQVLVTSIASNSWKMQKSLDQILHQFDMQEQSILKLTRELDFPPVAIVRAVVVHRVAKAYPRWRGGDRKRLVREILRGENEELLSLFLPSFWEQEQLRIAKNHDVMTYEHDKGQVHADLWETALYNFLKEERSDINFLSESEMRQAGALRTPDCLFLDNVRINGRHVRWIDMKNSYASGLKASSLMIKKMENQIARYENEFGEGGALVFKHGFSKKLEMENPDTLFLDAGPLIPFMGEPL